MAAGFCTLFAVGGCVGPIRQPEAQMLAGAELRKFCRDQPCGATKLTAAQKLKNRWLVDFDSANGKYTVIVDADGNAQVTVWDKSLTR